MGCLIIPIGIAGCGKTYWATKMWKEYGIPAVSSDNIREELFGDASIQKKPGLVFKKVYEQARSFLNIYSICILDATNLKRKYRLQAIKEIQPNEVIYVIMNNDLDRALFQNSARERTVPEEVIRHMHESFKHNYPIPEKDFIEDIKYSIYNVNDNELYKYLERKNG